MNALAHDIAQAVADTGVVGVAILVGAALIGMCLVLTLARAERPRLAPLAATSFLPAVAGLCCAAYGYTVSTGRIHAQLAAFGQDAAPQILALRQVWRSVANVGAWASLCLFLLVTLGFMLAERLKHGTQNNEDHIA